MSSASWAAEGPGFGPWEHWNRRRGHARAHGRRDEGQPDRHPHTGRRHAHDHHQAHDQHQAHDHHAQDHHGDRRHQPHERHGRHDRGRGFGPRAMHMSRGGFPGGPGFMGRGFGPGDFPFGPKFWGHHGGRRSSHRAGRGDVRAGILALLAEEPRNGYQIIQELQQRSGGAWRVSPGSVYPALSQLEDEGLIVADQSHGKRVFTLTDAGRAYVQEHQDETSAPWNAFTAETDEDAGGLYSAIGPTMMAVAQVAQAGSKAQVAEATRLIEELRRSLYRILAEGDTGSAPDNAAEPDADE